METTKTATIRGIMDLFRKKMSVQFYILCFNIFMFGTIIISPIISFAYDAQQNESRNGFYSSDEKKGFYNYIDPEKEEEQEEEKIQNSEPPVYSYQEMWNMHPDDFQAYLDNVTKFAVMKPTDESGAPSKWIQKYLEVQDVSRRKSKAFASVVGLAGQQNPQYTNEDTYSLTNPGKYTITTTRKDNIDQKIEQSKNNYALVMFSQPGCSFCETQKDILKWFTSEFDWAIRDVDIITNPEFAAEFGISITPSIIMVSKESGDFMPISTGVIAKSNLKKRIYRTAKYLDGEISAEQWGIYEYQENSGSDPMAIINGYE